MPFKYSAKVKFIYFVLMGIGLKLKILILLGFILPFWLQGGTTTDSLLQALQNPNLENEERIELLFDLKYQYQYTNPDTALHFMEEATQIADLIESDSLIAETQFHKGILNAIKGDFESAAVFYEAALKIYEEQNNVERIAYTYRNLGVVFQNTNNPIQASEYFYESLQLHHDLNDSLMIHLIHYDLGSMYYNNRAYEKALESMQNCVAFFEQAPKYSRELAISYNGLGLSKEALNKSGLSEFKAALKLYHKIQDSVSIAQVHNNIGMHFIANNQLDSAMYHTQKSLAVFEALNYQRNASATYINLARIYRQKNRLDSAYFLIHKGIELASYRKEGLFHTFGLELLADLEEVRGNYKASLEYLKELRAIDDEYLSIDKQSKLAEVEARFSIERQQIKNERLLREKEQQEAVIANQETVKLLLVLLVGTVAIFATTLGAWLVRIQRINKRLEAFKNELEKKQSDLERSNKFKDQLIRIIGHDLRSPIGNAKSLLELISPPKEERETYDLAVNSIGNSLNLLNNLLDWVKSEDLTNKDNSTAECTVDELFDDLKQQFASRLSMKELDMNSFIEDKIVIKARSNLMFTIMRNLISNSIKFTERGGSITLSAELFDPKYAVIRIKDTGRGMTPEQVKAISSSQIASTQGTENEMGSGVGLMIVKSLLEQLNSKLEITSEPNKGSEFSFRVPVAML